MTEQINWSLDGILELQTRLEASPGDDDPVLFITIGGSQEALSLQDAKSLMNALSVMTMQMQKCRDSIPF